MSGESRKNSKLRTCIMYCRSFVPVDLPMSTPPTIMHGDDQCIDLSHCIRLSKQQGPSNWKSGSLWLDGSGRCSSSIACPSVVLAACRSSSSSRSADMPASCGRSVKKLEELTSLHQGRPAGYRIEMAGAVVVGRCIRTALESPSWRPKLEARSSQSHKHPWKSLHELACRYSRYGVHLHFHAEKWKAGYGDIVPRFRHERQIHVQTHAIIQARKAADRLIRN